MLQAVLRDLAAIPGDFKLYLPRDSRLPALPASTTRTVISVDSQRAFENTWQALLQRDALFLVIAPESNGILAQRCLDIQQAGKIWLGCSQAALRICSDKLATYQRLTQHAIASIATQTLQDWLQQPQLPDSTQWVVKPRDGAGSVDTFLFNSLPEILAFKNTLNADHLADWLIQPFITGQACSMSLLCSHTDVEVLSLNQQSVQIDHNRLFLEKVEILLTALPLFDLTAATTLAKQIHTAIDGLWGYVGVDLLITPDAVIVVEINPRITSAYCELREKTAINGLQRMLDAHFANTLKSVS